MQGKSAHGTQTTGRTRADRRRAPGTLPDAQVQFALARAAAGTRHQAGRHGHATLQPGARRWHAAVGEIVALPAEYAAWLQALPEVTHDSPTAGQALQAIVALDLDEIAAIEPPRGFGRD